MEDSKIKVVGLATPSKWLIFVDIDPKGWKLTAKAYDVARGGWDTVIEDQKIYAYARSKQAFYALTTADGVENVWIQFYAPEITVIFIHPISKEEKIGGSFETVH